MVVQGPQGFIETSVDTTRRAAKRAGSVLRGPIRYHNRHHKQTSGLNLPTPRRLSSSKDSYNREVWHKTQQMNRNEKADMTLMTSKEISPVARYSGV